MGVSASQSTLGIKLDARALQYLDGGPTEKQAAYKAASPALAVTSQTPPTLLIQGGLDPIVWPYHSHLLENRLAAAHRQCLYLDLPWASHGCDAILRGPSGQLSLYVIEYFLARQLVDVMSLKVSGIKPGRIPGSQ